MLRQSTRAFTQGVSGFKTVAGAQSQVPTMLKANVSTKELKIRIRGVTNIAKITKSMKMIAAAKLRGVENNLKAARPFLKTMGAVFPRQLSVIHEAPGTTKEENLAAGMADEEAVEKSKGPRLYMLASSSRGMCGAIHSNIARRAKALADEAKEAGEDVEFAIIGDKTKNSLIRSHGKKIGIMASELGRRRPPNFDEASVIAEHILDRKFSQLGFVYNEFKSVISYEVIVRDYPSLASLQADPTFVSKFEEFEFDSDKAEVLYDLHQFNAACEILNALLENSTSEEASRMTAMDNATRNAGEVIDKLTILFNRVRQAGITTELTEIVSGAAALE